MNYNLKYKTFIFDMDGLLINSEYIAFIAFKKICKKLNITPTIKEYSNVLGVNKVKRNTLIKKLFPTFNDYYIKLWEEQYLNLLNSDNLKVKNGVIDFLEILKKNNVNIAVATSTNYSLALFKLKECSLFDYFNYIISGDRVKHGKPDPEIFLNVAQFFSNKPNECIIFEDSENGINSAYNANMDCIQIVDLVKPNKNIKNKTLAIYHSFDELIKNNLKYLTKPSTE